MKYRDGREVSQRNNLNGQQVTTNKIESNYTIYNATPYPCPSCGTLYLDKRLTNNYCGSCGKKFDLD